MCPFCKGDKLQTVKNSMGKHWVFCTTCKGSGPHTDDPESARIAFENISLRGSVTKSLRERLFGKGEG